MANQSLQFTTDFGIYFTHQRLIVLDFGHICGLRTECVTVSCGIGAGFALLFLRTDLVLIPCTFVFRTVGWNSRWKKGRSRNV